MGEIKSALELALEKTQNIKGDKEQLLAVELTTEGKRITSKFMNEPGNEDLDIKKQLDAQKDPAKLKYLKKGIFDTAMANLVLPSEEGYEEKMAVVEKVLLSIIKDRKKVDVLFKQLSGFFSQFLENKEKIHKSLETQFAPRLRQKEEQLAKQTGRKVKLNPAQDPEFLNYLNMNLAKLDEQYSSALDEVREELKRLAED